MLLLLLVNVDELKPVDIASHATDILSPVLSVFLPVNLSINVQAVDVDVDFELNDSLVAAI